ncbi:unnamed protein product [Penicillium nalgiovense]|nr:unnamed protein product [Penicillium nalgiovense]CAG8183921.1 unnamed protein product [Penicillium nalgiovense]
MDCFPIISLRSLLPKWVGPLFFQDNPSSVWGDQENKDAESSLGSDSILELPDIELPRIINFWQMPEPLTNTAVHRGIEDAESFLGPDGILRRIGKLPTGLIDSIIEASVFSEPLGSHDALHNLQAFCQQQEDYIVKSRIHTVLRSPSIRKRIETDWELCPGFDHTKTCRRTFDKTAPHDLASRTIVNCPQCFTFLLDHQTIRPSSFCRDGQSFYLIAVKSDNRDLIKRIMSAIEPQDLFKPFSVNAENSGRKSILQFTTRDAQLFQGCWERLRPIPEIRLSSTLGSTEIMNLCKFAGKDLANQLLHRGVDLRIPNPNNGVPNWHQLLYQQNPEPMLYWFWSRGTELPGDLLTYAARRNCVAGVVWISNHTESHDDWRQAVSAAADKVERESAEIFEFLIQHPPPGYRRDGTGRTGRTLSEDLLITIVGRACSKSRVYDLLLSGECSNSDIQRLQSDKAWLEEVAVQKIQTIQGLNETAGVVGIKVQAREAGLKLVTEALET